MNRDEIVMTQLLSNLDYNYNQHAMIWHRIEINNASQKNHFSNATFEINETGNNTFLPSNN